jgi:hypothetical protein
MPASLNLPYRVCYGVVRLIRRFRKPVVRKAADDGEEYFPEQCTSSEAIVNRYTREFPFQGTVIDVGSGLGGRSP